MNQPTHKQPAQEARRTRPITPQERREMARLRTQEHLTYKEIGAQFGKHESTVYQAIAGMVPPVHGVKATRARQLREKGLLWREVAAVLGYRNAEYARCAVYKYERLQQDRLANIPWE